MVLLHTSAQSCIRKDHLSSSQILKTSPYFRSLKAASHQHSTWRSQSQRETALIHAERKQGVAKLLLNTANSLLKNRLRTFEDHS